MDTTTDPRREADAPAVPTAEGRRRIGEIFVELGFVTSAELEAALEVQRRTGARIGEILVEQGSLTRLDLASALAEHWEPRRVGPNGTASLLQGAVPAVSPEQLRRTEEDHAAILELERRVVAAEQRLEAAPAAPPEPRRSFGLRRRADVESAVQARLDAVDERLAPLGPLPARVEELQLALEDLEVVRAADAVAVGSRLRQAEDELAALGGIELRLEERLDRGLADRLGALEARLERVEARPQQPPFADPEPRLVELSVRLDRIARDAHDRAVHLADELRREAAATAAEIGQSLRVQSDETRGIRAEAASLAARLDEVQALRTSDARAARAAGERLAAEVAGLARRLEAQAAQAEEQARATELAVRRGLASLGKRMVGSEAAYAKPGKGLRRAIDRLGAAIVEADARHAGQVPAAGAEGFVAFVPTADGYRLVEVQGEPPELGGTVELPGGEGGFVVTRYGRSPLPFDARPCAYLEL